MAEPGVPHPDGPRPDGPGRAGRPRAGRDPVALAAWRRVAEQRRRSAGGGEDVDPVEDLVAEPAPEVSEVSPSPEIDEPGLVDVPEPARPRPLDGAVLREPGGDVPREARPGTDAEVARPPRPLPDDGPPAPGRLHEVLLGLAGRIDDDALTAVREMVAAEDDAEAAELLAGCLLADEVGLSPDERGVLGPWFATARVDPDLLARLPVDPDALHRSGHRFVPTAAGVAPAAPLARAARRLSGVVAVRESWRVTPAGAAPGPVPHRVVLVETADPDDCDHVVHHLAHAARGLGGTSVEVFASGITLPAYHRDALAAARPLTTSDPLPARAPAAQAAPVDPPRASEVVREDGETWRTVADAGTARLAPPAPMPEEPAPVVAEAPAPEVWIEPEPEPDPEPAAPTSIDDDLSLTARRIAALWARPVPEDFSAPLPADSLEQTRLEPQPDPDTEAGPDHVHVDGASAVDEIEDGVDGGVDDDPVGRHGRAPRDEGGTTAFLARPPRPAPRRNGHHLGDHPVEAEEVDPGEPTPPDGTAIDPEDDAAQVQRARHSRGRPEEPTPSARFGHDARYGAGPGPAWPGAPVTGDRPGPDTLFTSPVEIGEEPVTLGTNGHRHDAVPVVPPEPHEVDEPATGPVAWSAAPPRAVNGTPLHGSPADDTAPRPVGDVAPPWATADGPAWTQEQAGWPPPPAPVPPTYRPPQEPAPSGPVGPADAEVTGGWAPDTDDSVAQLSDRERELLARLHEELAQRERAEGTDPFAGPSGRPQPPRPQGPPGPPPERRNGQGPPPGRTNGHGLPGGHDPAS
ncbi:hypothetical protein [Actinomycetospora sp. NBRC 106378]|uniref:hypothetical protein n=1 Tax=Actinomycetospora sp. NBRC 106378 TaxID=3032208 RepID=UPI0024A2CA6F|nr:hypothetical protein [Actinomycetospora sp. NBRC 106378]GLZ52898.1 hypothetical protein Acsp07_25150 [Actinomycetospora sp. NBRC 106378]